MRNQTVGKVLVRARIQNLMDLELVRQGMRADNEARSVEVDDALVDTGATMLSMPRRLIEQLGLRRFSRRVARTSAGPASFDIYAAVRLTVLGRDCTMDVAAVPDDCPVLIGQVPLELLDFIVDPVGQRLLPNPAHGGEQMIEMY